MGTWSPVNRRCPDVVLFMVSGTLAVGHLSQWKPSQGQFPRWHGWCDVDSGNATFTDVKTVARLRRGVLGHQLVPTRNAHNLVIQSRRIRSVSFG